MNHSPTTMITTLALTLATAAQAQQTLNEDFKIVPNTTVSDTFFGGAIDTNNGLAIIGALGDDVNGVFAGSAYLFDLSDGTQLMRLTKDNPQVLDQFGKSVAIDNGLIAIGAPGVNSEAGRVYLYDAQSGDLLHALPVFESTLGDNTGTAVAMNNDLLVIGAPNDDDNNSSGSIYIYQASTGTLLAKRFPDINITNAQFGTSLAIGNGLIAVGTFANSIFLFDDTTFEQLAQLTAPAGGTFGKAIAIDNGLIVIGADTENNFIGATYIYDATTFTQLHRIVPDPTPTGFLSFGKSVAINNGLVAVGGTGFGQTLGAAAVYDALTAQKIADLVPTDAQPFTDYGSAISILNGIVVVGANRENGNGVRTGSSYRFSLPGTNCPADLTGDGTLNFFDVSAFLSAFAANDPIADFTDDAIFNFFDVSAFLQAFTAGCP